jgi:hypothetical protein
MLGVGRRRDSEISISLILLAHFTAARFCFSINSSIDRFDVYYDNQMVLPVEQEGKLDSYAGLDSTLKTQVSLKPFGHVLAQYHGHDTTQPNEKNQRKHSHQG